VRRTSFSLSNGSPTEDVDKLRHVPLREVLTQKRNAIVKKWLARTLLTYPENTAGFLLHDKDPFRNPVGHTLAEGLRTLFEALLDGVDTARVMPVLEGIVRIRAVQDFSAGEAVAFIFLLKKVIRDELEHEMEGLSTLDEEIDHMALLAFDLFMKSREKIYEIKADEARRRFYVQLNRPVRERSNQR
jgi:hypothetical protein